MYVITWIATHLPTPKGWMAELAMNCALIVVQARNDDDDDDDDDG